MRLDRSPERSEVLASLLLKGRASATALAAAMATTEAQAMVALDSLLHDGLAVGTKVGYRLTAEGREVAQREALVEQAETDQGRLSTLYAEFCAFNGPFKALVTQWQLKGEAELNDHRDAAYDEDVLRRLRELHDDFLPLADRAVTIVPRLWPYPSRFSAAIEAIAAGNTEFVASPAIDSYHTVWFEFHEELIRVSGRSRESEAAAGRA